MILNFLLEIAIAVNVKLDYFAFPAFQITVVDGALEEFPKNQAFVESEEFKCIKVSEPIELIPNPKPSGATKAEAIKIVKSLPCLDYSYDNTWIYRYCDGMIVQEFSQLIKDQFKDDPETLKLLRASRYTLGVIDSLDDEELNSDLDGSFYLKKFLIDGDYCAKINRNRVVIVNYFCGEHDYISSVIEISVCVYKVTVKVKNLCKLPPFQPVDIAIPGNIQCIKKNGFINGAERIGPDKSLLVV